MTIALNLGKTVKCLLFIPVLAWQAALVSAADFDFIKGGDIAAMLADAPAAPKVLTPVPATEPLAVQPLRNWTVMVYQNGKNDLTFSVRDDLNEMEEVGSSENINVVAELGHIGTGDGVWPVSRVFVKKDQYPYYISSQAAEKRDNANMGDWKELADFIRWSKTNFPARKYMLIISGHGSGWDSQGKPSSTEKGLSFDDQSGRHIDSQGLRLALETTGGVDVYAADACLMQMVEVAYEIRKNVKFVVGSEDSTPGSGFQYRDFLLKANAVPDAAPRELAAAAVEAFVQSYSGAAQRRDVAQSYLETAALDGLIPLVNDWTAAAGRAEKKALERAFKEVKRFSDSECVDLADLMRLTAAYARTPELRAASERLGEYTVTRVVGLNRHTGAVNERAGGLSIYVPWGFRKNYRDLQFSMDSRWDEFVAGRVKTFY